MYQDTLYGDAARGCHHRGDGPDASQRSISHNRQRLGDSAMRLRDETRLVAEEVGAGEIVHDVAQEIAARLTMEPRVRITKRRR
jgi:hypothetical protein